MAPAGPEPAGGASAARIYGRRGFDHAGGVLLTLMWARGATALAARLRPFTGEGLRLEHAPGRLPVCREIRDGELARLVAALDVQLLDFQRWSETKRALGDAVYR